MAGTYENIKSLPVVSRQGGSQQRILIADYDGLTTVAKPDPAATNVKDRSLVKTPHVAGTGGGFFGIYVTKDTGSIKLTPVGAPDRRSYKVEGKFLHPGESDAIVSFQNQALNGRFIVMFTLPGSTELIQVGSDEFQVEIIGSYDSTENGGDGRGILFTFECYMSALWKYKSTIPLLS